MRDQGTWLRIDPATIGRDVGFLLVFFAVAAGVGIVELPLILKVVIALASGGLIFFTLRRSGTLRAGGLMLGGLFYVAFVIGAIIAVT